MSGAEPAKYQWGRRVLATTDLFNDGSYPDRAETELLVNAGDAGEIVQIGSHVETETTVYLVEFSETLIIGCFEEEIEPG
jgi:nitrogen fixation protein NifZ